jgi:hypothetical protein
MTLSVINSSHTKQGNKQIETGPLLHRSEITTNHINNYIVQITKQADQVTSAPNVEKLLSLAVDPKHWFLMDQDNSRGRLTRE